MPVTGRAVGSFLSWGARVGLCKDAARRTDRPVLPGDKAAFGEPSKDILNTYKNKCVYVCSKNYGRLRSGGFPRPRCYPLVCRTSILCVCHSGHRRFTVYILSFGRNS